MTLPKALSIHGFLNVLKPEGITSRDAVNRLQRWVRPAKIGHAGTLDPLATGVLVIAVGHSTRLIPEVQAGIKCYHGEFRLGLQTDTDDITGQVLSKREASHITRSDLERELPGFLGDIAQVPPRFSAVHVEGQRAYDLARKGTAFDLEAKRVTVHQLELRDFASPNFVLEVKCGSGTYIRSIGRDLGEKLGCGTTMTALDRRAVGPFTHELATPLDEFTPENWRTKLFPPTFALPEFSQHVLSPDQTRAVRCGQLLRIEHSSAASRIILVDENRAFVALAEWSPQKSAWQPKVVFPAD